MSVRDHRGVGGFYAAAEESTRADAAFLDRIERLLDRLELPVPPPVDVSEVTANLARDKKARDTGLVWVLPMAPGLGERVRGIPTTEVAAEIGSFLRECRSGVGPV